MLQSCAAGGGAAGWSRQRGGGVVGAPHVPRAGTPRRGASAARAFRLDLGGRDSLGPGGGNFLASFLRAHGGSFCLSGWVAGRLAAAPDLSAFGVGDVPAKRRDLRWVSQGTLYVPRSALVLGCLPLRAGYFSQEVDADTGLARKATWGRLPQVAGRGRPTHAAAPWIGKGAEGKRRWAWPVETPLLQSREPGSRQGVGGSPGGLGLVGPAVAWHSPLMWGRGAGGFSLLEGSSAGRGLSKGQLSLPCYAGGGGLSC